MKFLFLLLLLLAGIVPSAFSQEPLEFNSLIGQTYVQHKAMPFLKNGILEQSVDLPEKQFRLRHYRLGNRHYVLLEKRATTNKSSFTIVRALQVSRLASGHKININGLCPNRKEHFIGIVSLSGGNGQGRLTYTAHKVWKVIPLQNAMRPFKGPLYCMTVK